MLENIRLSLRGIWSHKMRSFLTMLGIIIGIASIIAIVSTIKGTNEQIKANLIGDGSNTVTIQLVQDSYAIDFSYQDVPDGIPIYDASIKKRLNQIDHVIGSSMFHQNTYSSSIYYKNTSLSSSTLYGIDEDYLSVSGMQVVKGRAISEEDVKRFNKVALIDESVVSSAFGDEDPLGKTLDISGEPYVVIGVVDKKTTFEPTINSVDDYYTYMSDSASCIYIADSTWPVIGKYDVPYSFIVKADSTDSMTEVSKACANVLNASVTSESVSYKSQDLASEASDLQNLSSSTNNMLVGIAFISLLVGGIGVMNIMLVSVTERTKEIGLKKALGAPRRVILLQFLTEAIMLSGIGGVIGIIVGLILANVISFMASIPTAISIPSIILGVGFSMVVGVVFGIVPSVKASKLNPIDALRYE